MSLIRQRTSWSDQLVGIAHQLIPHLATPDLRAGFLFGSAAWGDADAASDLDIMLVLDRPAGYREVTRVRVADLLGTSAPGAPHFVDLDRISVETFSDAVGKGGWGQRVVHSVVLADTADWYTELRAQVTASYVTPAACLARFQQKQAQVEEHRVALRQVASEDVELAALHARLSLEEAAGALLEVTNQRVSLTHNVESVQQELIHLDHARLFSRWCRLLGLNAGPVGVEQSRHAFRTFADALRAWMTDPAIGGQLSGEDQAWAAFTYSQETFDEIAQKVASFEAAKRLPALQYYLDGLMLVVVRLNAGKVVLLKARGAAGRMAVPDFQVALRAYPHLYETWVSALRLRPLGDRLQEADEVAAQFLQIGERALQKTMGGSMTGEG